MKAQTQNPESTSQTFTLELSFIEMHFLMKAMECYSRKGYNLDSQEGRNEAHAEGAEKLHDEMTEIYCTGIE